MYCYWHINHLTCLQVGLVEQQELHQMRNRFYSTPTDQLWDDQWFLVSRCSSELEYDAYTFPDGRLLLNVLNPYYVQPVSPCMFALISRSPLWCKVLTTS